MQDGTVGEFEWGGGVGLIDADDGQIVFFSVADLTPSDATTIKVGARVHFTLRHASTSSHHVDELCIT